MGRQEKKQRTKEKVIDAGRELFFSKGYDETTTDEIATKADIGVGTLFNYFDTKADLLIEVFSEDFVEELDELEYQLSDHDLHCETSDLVYRYLYQRIRRYRGLSKKLFRQMMSVAASAFKSKPEVLKNFIGLDFMLVDDLIEFLNHLKDKRVLEEDFDANEAAELIYCAAGFEFIMFVYQDQLSMDDFLSGLKGKLQFIFR